MKLKQGFLLCLALQVFLACGKPDLAREALQYGSEPYLQKKVQGCMEVSGLFVAPRWRAIQSVQAEGNPHLSGQALEAALDSAEPGDKGLEFRIRVSPSAACRDSVYFHNSDIVYSQGYGDEGLTKAITEFNTALASKVWLKAGKLRIKPSLAHVESAMGLDNSREIWVLFRLDEAQREAVRNARTLTLAAEGIVPGSGLFILAWPGKVLTHGA